MKKFILLMTLLTVTLSAKPCMTDIYFGNGVWNDRRDAIDNMDALKKFMLYQANVRLNPNKETVDYQFKYAHNPSHGLIDDLIETFWQLKESGQISEGFFSTVYAALTWEESTEFYNKLTEIIQQYNQDVTTMYTIYQNASFNQKHNVLLVAHSQGNLWGNKMYSLFTDEQKKKFRMVSVATPADHVMVPGKTEPYVTASEDYVIGSIPGSLPGNVDGRGHEFVGTYLTASINAPRKIALYVKSAYDNLMQTTSCNIYRYTKVLMPIFGTLKITGRVTYANLDEEIGTIVLNQRDAYWDDREKRLKCGLEDTPYTDGNGWGDNWAYGHFGGQSGKMEWLPGRIHTKRELNARSKVEENVIMGKKCVTLSLKKDGELYDFININISQ